MITICEELLSISIKADKVTSTARIRRIEKYKITSSRARSGFAKISK